MTSRYFRVSLMSLALLVVSAVPYLAMAQEADAPCGRDDYGLALQCALPDAAVYMESRCLSSADVNVCLGYHRTACQVKGLPAACHLFAIGQNCYNGDADTCKFYVSLLQANTACHVRGDQGACNWLSEQRF